MITEQDLGNICINVARKLITLPNEKDEIADTPNLQTRLIFPQYGKKEEVRISEQESRVLFCQEVEAYDKEIFYSVETPTEKKYRFGKKLDDIKIDDSGQSALSDMSLFELEDKKLKRKVNIEFKSHNVEEAHIAKDILKLIAEPCSGLFFHTLESVNSGTLTTGKEQKGVLVKYREAITNLQPHNDLRTHWQPEEKYILFAICILKPEKVLLMKTFIKSNLDGKDSFFDIGYKVKNDKINFSNLNAWDKLKL